MEMCTLYKIICVVFSCIIIYSIILPEKNTKFIKNNKFQCILYNNKINMILFYQNQIKKSMIKKKRAH
jgi:hypothetical protein